MDAKKKQLLFAILLAAVAVVITRLYVEGQISQYKPKGLVRVAVARGPIQAGSPLLPAMVTDKEVPKDVAPISAVLYSDAESYVGQHLSVNVPPGAYLMQNYFEVRRAVGSMLSEEVVGKRSRAVTIPVSQLNSLSGSVLTGDLIDILYTFNVPNTSQHMTILLLQNVPVIATGEYSAAEQELQGGGSGHYSAITLLLKLEDAAKLKFAQKSGSIDILLRNREDSQQVEFKPLSNVEDLLGEKEKKALRELSKQGEPTEDQKAALNRRLQSLYSDKGMSMPSGE